MRPDFWIIHLADGIQSVRRRERFSGQRAGRNEIPIKLRWLGRFAAFRSVNRGHARIFVFWQPDPEIQFEWPGKIFLPITRKRFSSYSPNELIQKEAKRAR